LTINFHQSR